MNSGSSAFMRSGSQVARSAAVISSYQRSRPSTHSTGRPVRLTTTTFCTDWVAGFFRASSTLVLSGTMRPPRRLSSEVITNVDWQSSMRLTSESGEKPPNTIEWMAPMRAQASIATAASGIIGR